MAKPSMSVYAKTIRTLAEVKTITAHMVSLGKIRAESEDQELGYLIANLVVALQYFHQQNKARSTPTSLTFQPAGETNPLLNYCNFHERSKKPEWQVLAERNGWKPPGPAL